MIPEKPLNEKLNRLTKDSIHFVLTVLVESITFFIIIFIMQAMELTIELSCNVKDLDDLENKNITNVFQLSEVLVYFATISYCILQIFTKIKEVLKRIKNQ